MTKTAKKASKVTSIKPAAEAFTSTTPCYKDDVTIGATDPLIKSVTILASAIMFAAPAFATQANPQNILALSDLMFKYVKGEINVQQPGEEAGAMNQAQQAQGNTTVFG